MALEPLWLRDRARRKFAIRVNGLFPGSLQDRAFKPSRMMGSPGVRAGPASQGIQLTPLSQMGKLNGGEQRHTWDQSFSALPTTQCFPSKSDVVSVRWMGCERRCPCGCRCFHLSLSWSLIMLLMMPCDCLVMQGPELGCGRS